MSFPEDFGSWREGFSLAVPGLLKSPKCIPTHVYNVFPFQDRDSGLQVGFFGGGGLCVYEGEINKN